MIDALAQFHFIRPLWLLVIIPLAGIIIALWKYQQKNTGFERLVGAELMPYLTTGNSTQPSHWPLYGLAFLWLLTSIALAGPTWKQRAQPVYQSTDALVIVLDLSPSMLAQDLQPSRIDRARYKIRDLLAQRKEGLTALIAYAGEAHVVTPLTDDISTINNLLPTLSPGLLPIPGSNIEMAVEMSVQLISDAGLSQGQLILITDGIDSSAESDIKRALNKRFNLSILGVGTAEGGTIPYQQGELKTSTGETVIARLNNQQLQQIASDNGGIYTGIQAGERDVNALATRFNKHPQERKTTVREYDQWHEFGPYLLLFLLPLLAMSFRRGWLLGLLLLPLYPETSYAINWQDLWLNNDQRAQRAYHNNDTEQAAKQFQNKRWRGAAEYKNGNYQAALEDFSNTENPQAIDYYNSANAHAQLQQFEQALKAYEQALKIDPNLSDAAFNRDMIKKLLEQQNAQNQDPQQGENQEQDKSQDQQQSANEQGSKNDSSPDNSEANQNANNQQQSGQQDTPEPNEEQREQAQKSAQQDDTQKEQAQKDQQSAEQAQKEQQSQQAEASADDTPLEANAAAQDTQKTEEQQQALNQWLRKIPDDPSGLLRRKFEYEFRKRRKEYRQGKWAPPENNAHQRY